MKYYKYDIFVLRELYLAMNDFKENLLEPQQIISQKNINRILDVEKRITPKQIKNLQIIVHPSYLIENPVADFLGKTDWSVYKPRTRKMQSDAQERFTPRDEAEVTLIMPHEEPTLESWRTSKRIKKNDPDDITWTDLYKNIKRSTQFPENVATIGSLTYYSDPNETEKERQDVENKLVVVLQERGLTIGEETNIILAGEFRDVCIYEVAKKLLLLPQVKKLKIDKIASFTTAYHFISEHGVETTESDRHEGLINGLKNEFQIREDDEYVFVEKRQAADKPIVTSSKF